MSLLSTSILLLESVAIPFLLFYFSFILIRDYLRYRDLPPGPRGWPIVGSLFQLGPRAYEGLADLSEKYGNFFSIKLGYEQAIVLNDYEAVREALVENADVFSARPDCFVMNYGIKNRDITFSPDWKEKRRFMTQNIKSFGFGRSSSEELIMESINMVVEDIDASKGSPMGFQYLFFLPIINVIWKYCADHPMPKNDATSKKFCDLINSNFVGLGNQIINFMPLLRFVPGGFGFWKHQRDHEKVWTFLMDEIAAHRKSFTPGQPRDFIDVYIQEIQSRVGTPTEGKDPYNDEHLTGTLYDLFLGGSDTTSNTLMWGFLLLSIHPEIQQKVADEMKKVIGDRPICFSDITKLPYLEAMIMEVHRKVSLVPLSIFHATSREIKFRGYIIPKGTCVIQNIFAVHKDPKCWKEPEKFLPERFLNEKNQVVKPPYWMPFSVGQRNCPGEPMAKMELHLFFGYLLQKYRFALPPGTAIPSLEPIVGLTLAPKPFSLCVTAR